MKLALFELVRIPLFALAALLGFSEVVRGNAIDAVYATAYVEARVLQTDHVRAGDVSSVDVEITNTSSSPCDVVVSLAPGYADVSDAVTMLPEPPDDVLSVRLVSVAPGEQRLVALEIRAGAPGPRDGELRIETGEAPALVVPLHTLVAP